ncbi:hypothetical protein [Faecalibacter rhinopitheci]|uniref:Uncharacterized protein n=1 Tax=Faecalibacter rhinopitheci TaxID=2779678 RepID=A0A8J7FRB0_9FLAO|nr:hypothetical protein [Faecalibacter rhinopitheci]MBF0598149.1 hypothetical protein [Faecalibacter rhinopitheci]MBQ0148339.1 hypothetical protein [Candidatus Onthonaster equi]
MKYFALMLSLLFTGSVFGQENEGLFAVEYEMNGQQMNSFGYSVENCSQTLVHNTWQNWVLNKGGNFNILKKYEANNLQFKNSEDKYKVILSIVEDTPVKFTLINTLIDQNGMYFSENNPSFNEIYEKLKDLSYQTRRACVRNNLKVANESMIRVSKQNVDLQTKKGNSIKSYLKSSNELLKLENKKNLLGEKLDLIENQLERATEDKKVEVLMKKKDKVESNFHSVDGKIQTLTAKVTMSEETSQALDEQIDQVTSQLQTQRSNIENLKTKFNSIER